MKILQQSALFKWVTKVWELPGNKRKIAGGFALGWWLGFLPLVGMQALLALTFSSILKLNKTAAVLAVFNTNLFTGVFIYAINYKLGTFFLGVQPEFIFPEKINFTFLVMIFNSGSEVFFSLAVGGILTGTPTAIIVYYLLRYSKKKEPKVDQIFFKSNIIKP
jgi:uncharacterized protein